MNRMGFDRGRRATDRGTANGPRDRRAPTAPGVATAESIFLARATGFAPVQALPGRADGLAAAVAPARSAPVQAPPAKDHEAAIRHEAARRRRGGAAWVFERRQTAAGDARAFERRRKQTPRAEAVEEAMVL